MDWPANAVNFYSVINIVNFYANSVQPTCFIKEWSFREDLILQASPLHPPLHPTPTPTPYTLP